MELRSTAAGLALVLLTACAHVPGGARGDAEGARRLEVALAALPGPVRRDEAAWLARASYAATAALAARYRPLRPPHLGNLLFHVGLRERALCCHWVEDLLRALGALGLSSLELHWGVAHHGSRWREHSAVVAVPAGRPFADGLVLDAWRHSGALYFARVDEDRYPWRLHPADDQRDRLACSDDAS